MLDSVERIDWLAALAAKRLRAFRRFSLGFHVGPAVEQDARSSTRGIEL